MDVSTEDTSSTGNCQKFYRNYTGLVKVFAGARDGHPYNLDGSKPLEEIGTIEVDFKEDNGDNIGYANVKSFVKPDITADFDYDYENSHSGCLHNRAHSVLPIICVYHKTMIFA